MQKVKKKSDSRVEHFWSGDQIIKRRARKQHSLAGNFNTSGLWRQPVYLIVAQQSQAN